MTAIILTAPTTIAQSAPLSPQASLGRDLFTNTGLSASGRQSCASCHDPKNHYAPSNDLAVALGGPTLRQRGLRAVPSLTYKNEIPDFAIDLANPDGSASAPGGGHDWDGRMPSIEAQSVMPLLSPYEMANINATAFAARVHSQADLFVRFQHVFGKAAVASPDNLLKATGIALGAYQHEDISFHPYDSKYDQYVNGKINLTPAEKHGMALFNDAGKANCSSCHTAGVGPGLHNGTSVSQFSDFFFRNIGVPTMPQDAFFPYPDEGLCGPLRTDFLPAHNSSNAHYCGMFMTPSLRNTATRHRFFHNGSVRTLRDVVIFYATRDTDPSRWYGKNSHPQNAITVDREDMPFATQKLGAPPTLSDKEINDIISFLKTLTDGYGK
ncbi:cytochrome-c peroxidase [Neokomagataea anthophila]|uniref:cytochrome-c peroxidase n=1 Tax=Neokomagataea anthophila TaxID=2826925 RepID=UPI001BA64D6C|nr:cytochrome c peroxidase [Neokomagataea anthophila]